LFFNAKRVFVLVQAVSNSGPKSLITIFKVHRKGYQPWSSKTKITRN